jgi:hypothetical protein
MYRRKWIALDGVLAGLIVSRQPTEEADTDVVHGRDRGVPDRAREISRHRHHEAVRTCGK